MNRRQLLLGTGALIVGEPARRAYSFLNGAGLDRAIAFGPFYPGAVEWLAGGHVLAFQGTLEQFLKHSEILNRQVRAAYGPGILL